MMWLSAVLAVTLVSPLAWSQAEGSLVPPEPLPLGGYTERGDVDFQPGGDPLAVRVAVLTQGDLRVAIASAELLTIPASLVREVRTRLPEDVHLVLTATHTHGSFDSQLLNDRMTMKIPGIATYRERWLVWTAERIASTIRNALGQNVETPTEWRLVRGRGDGLNRGRREGADPDSTVTRLLAGDRSVLLHFAAHPTLTAPEELRLRSDWPGAWARVEGGLPLVGAIGDVSPVATGATGDERVTAFVQALAGVTGAGRTLEAPRLVVARAMVRLDTPRPSPAFVEHHQVPEVLAQLLVGRFAPSEAEVTVVGIGDLALVAVPGEVSSHLGRAMQDAGHALGFPDTVVVGLANGWMGYVLTAEDFARGGYEASLAFHGPEAGERLVDAVKDALRKARDHGRRQ